MSSRSSARSFFDLYAHGFVRVAAAAPRLVLADPAANATEIARLWHTADANGAALVITPELSLVGYTIDDLHQQAALLEAVQRALESLSETTRTGRALLAVGAPLAIDGRLFNCAVVLGRGQVLGVVPKSYLPNYREFYEKRQFAAARDRVSDTTEIAGRPVPFGEDLMFRCEQNPDFAVAFEICEDVWVPLPPSTFAALRGATVLANLSASNITVGKSAYRHDLAAGQSAKCLAAYVYVGAGAGESTTDLAWDGEAFVYENGECLARSERFASGSAVLFADVDLERLVQDRMRMTSFVDCATDHRAQVSRVRTVDFDFAPHEARVPLARRVERHPFAPSDPARRSERCREAYRIQVAGLVQRARAARVDKLVIGVSGGLDSTHALLVAVKAADALGLPRTNVLAYTMPGFATTSTTKDNALTLMRSLGVRSEVLDIRPSCEQMLADIGHPWSRGERTYDIAFENVQAGERTSHLFRLANLHGGFVVGTGDLSELALGWCTYGVGDHMSHYNVNASVPKTLIRHLIEWVADSGDVGADTSKTLRAILATPISPELVPGDDEHTPGQRTEEIVGPYDLHDFSLYYLTRRGYRPSKIAYLCAEAWTRDVEGRADANPAHSLDEIVRWLSVFLDRFLRTSQYKRSAIPNGPKVGSGGSLSPRGDWRAPSDAAGTTWLAELELARAWIERSRREA
ncbi:MAG: NAD(+) synthase [Planctomycetota bacterium]